MGVVTDGTGALGDGSMDYSGHVVPIVTEEAQVLTLCPELEIVALISLGGVVRLSTCMANGTLPDSNRNVYKFSLSHTRVALCSGTILRKGWTSHKDKNHDGDGKDQTWNLPDKLHTAPPIFQIRCKRHLFIFSQYIG